MASAPRHAVPPSRSRRNVLAALGVLLLLAAGATVLWLALRSGGDADRATSDGSPAGTPTAASPSDPATASTPDGVPSSSELPESVASSSPVPASAASPTSTSSVPAAVAPPAPTVPSEKPETPSPASENPAPAPADPGPADNPADPQPTNPATVDPASPESLAAAIVSYYDQMPSDTDRGWALLTTRFHTDIAHNRQYYQRFWDGIEKVSVSDATGTGPGTAEATLTYTLKDGRVSIERTRYYLVLDDGVLKIDSSSVLSARSG